MSQPGLWDDAAPPFRIGPIRRALDHDLAEARRAGRTFLATEVATLRRQANDLDRLESIMAGARHPKTWDYNPKTTAAQAYLDAVRRLFGEADADDPFLDAVAALESAEAARTGPPAALDRPQP